MKKTLLFLSISSILFLSACQTQSLTLPVDLSETQRLELESKAQELELNLKDLQNLPQENETLKPEETQTEEEAQSETEPKEALEGDNVDSPVEAQAPEAEGVEEALPEEGLQQEAASIDESEEVVPSAEEQEFILTVQLADVYQQLGKVGQAITLYEDYLAGGNQSYAVLSNLGRLHESVGQYDKAVAYYQQLMDEYHNQNYFFDIAKAYLAAGDFEKAQYNYNQWRVIKNDRNMNFERQLEALSQNQSQSQ